MSELDQIVQVGQTEHFRNLDLTQNTSLDTHIENMKFTAFLFRIEW